MIASETIGQGNPVTEDDAKSDSELLEIVNGTYNDYKHGRIPFERLWYKSAHFVIGNHWITWDTLENQWRKRRLNKYVPTPVTNKYASSGQRLISVISRIEPNWTFSPASDSEADIRAAEQCDIAKDVICEENHIESIRQRLAPWVVYTGNAYLLSGVEIEEEQEQEQPVLSENNPMMEGVPPEIQQILSQSPQQPQIKNGKLYTDVLSPYEVYLDQTIENFDDHQKILVVNRRSKEYVKKMWGQEVDDFDADSKLNYLESLGYICPDAYTTGYVHGRQKTRRAIVKRLFMKPSDKYPDGLYVVACGDKILEQNVLPKDSRGKPFIPISHIPFDKIAGAAFGRTPMDDVIPKQIQRNKIESLIELIVFRMASPIWLIPNGTSVNGFTGEPGSQLNYSMVGDKASAPQRIPGEQIPTSVVQFVASIDKDIEDLVSTFEALKGQSPYSGAPNIAIENLIEQGLTRFGPSLKNMAEGYRKWMIHQLEFFRTYGMTERTLAKKGDGSKWQIDKFKGADIIGAVNVKVESDSTIPRSSSVETAKVLEAINAKLIDIQDPNVRFDVLKKLKIQDLMEDVDGDRLAAVKENETLLAGGQIDVTPFIDNATIHIHEHKKAYWNDSYVQVRQILSQHISKHNMIADAEKNGGQMQPQGAPQGKPSGQVSQKGAKVMAAPQQETPPLPQGAA